MTDTPGPVRPHLLRGGGPGRHVDPRVATQAAVDLRVSMVLAVLGGTPVEDVAHEHDVELSLLNRWVRDFLRPEPDEARQRDRFLAAFAHELRTPVAVAGGWAMMLAEGDVPDDQVQASLVRLSDALRGLAEHIEDVELSTSASLGRVPLGLESVDVSGLARELAGSPGVRRGADVAVTAVGHGAPRSRAHDRRHRRRGDRQVAGDPRRARRDPDQPDGPGGAVRPVRRQ